MREYEFYTLIIHFIKYCVFFKNSRKLPPFPLQPSAVQKITSQKEKLCSHIALRALKVSYSDVGEGGVGVNCEKNTIFPEHPVEKGRF